MSTQDASELDGEQKRKRKKLPLLAANLAHLYFEGLLDGFSSFGMRFAMIVREVMRGVAVEHLWRSRAAHDGEWP